MRSIFFAAMLAASPALAHDFWVNGEEVPAWVRSSCCGKADAHHIRASALHIMADGYHIDGISTVIPMSRALPSQDGQVWGFWAVPTVPNPIIYCLFVPLNGA